MLDIFVTASMVALCVCRSRAAAAFTSRHTQRTVYSYRPDSLSLMKMSLSSVTSEAASSARSRGLFLATPLVPSAPLSALCDRPVYLKLDALQTSGSFKDRGMAHLCDVLQTTKGTSTKLVSSSGGNAGLAVTTVASQLGMEVDVIVPETTKPLVIEKLKSLGAKVTIHGENWNAADALARELVEKDPNAEYVSPYDNALLWTGHSSLIDEIVQEFEQKDEKLGAIVASVGGGGLICGIFEGLERHGLDCALIAAETEGAASFAKAFQKGSLVRLDSIDSVATSLGALEVTQVALDRAKSHMGSGGMVRESECTDAEAIDACVKFAADHRLLVEPACGAALAVLYSERLRKRALEGIEGAVVVEVCGGSGVNLELMQGWTDEFL